MLAVQKYVKAPFIALGAMKGAFTYWDDDVVTLATSARESRVTAELHIHEGAQHGFQFSGTYPVDADLAGWIAALS